MGKFLMGLGLLLLAGIVVFAAYVRLAPSDPAVWNVDPVTVRPPSSPNFDLMRAEGGTRTSPVFAMSPQELMAALNRVALATPRVSILAGSPEEDQITYIARSALWGFPDYISVRAMSDPGGARLAAFSRARFGQSDLGVNAKRMDGWLRELGASPT